MLAFPGSLQGAALNGSLQGSGLERVRFRSLFYLMDFISIVLSAVFQQHCHRHKVHDALFLKTVLESHRLGVTQMLPESRAAWQEAEVLRGLLSSAGC